MTAASPTPPPTSRRACWLQGFSQLELFLAIALLAVLLALAFPILARARGAGSVARCVNNLRLIGAGVQGYLSEHRQTFPPEPRYLSLNGFLLTIMAGHEIGILPNTALDLNPKGPVYQAWVCPADPTRGGMNQYGALHGVPGEEGENGINAHSYKANAYLFKRSMAEVAQPGKTILMTEFPWSVAGTRAIYPAGSSWSSMYPKEWHHGNVNVLFVDGHVEKLSAASLAWGQSNARLWFADYARGVVGMKP